MAAVKSDYKCHHNIVMGTFSLRAILSEVSQLIDQILVTDEHLIVEHHLRHVRYQSPLRFVVGPPSNDVSHEVLEAVHALEPINVFVFVVTHQTSVGCHAKGIDFDSRKSFVVVPAKSKHNVCKVVRVHVPMPTCNLFIELMAVTDLDYFTAGIIRTFLP